MNTSGPNQVGVALKIPEPVERGEFEIVHSDLVMVLERCHARFGEITHKLNSALAPEFPTAGNENTRDDYSTPICNELECTRENLMSLESRMHSLLDRIKI